MTIDGALFARVTENAACAARIGTRLYPVELEPKPIYPAAVYQTFAGRSVQCHTVGGSGRSRFTTVHVTAYAATRREAQEVILLIQAAIEAQQWTSDGTSVYSCWMVDTFDVERDSTARIEGVGHVYDVMHS